MQKTCRGPTGRPGRSTRSRTPGDCPRDCTSRSANDCPPCDLAGDLFAPRRPWSRLGSLSDALFYITLYGFRRHLL
jgi:hypothetical protein